MNPILIDIPECIYTERLLIRSPRPGDGVELNAAIRDSQQELKEWMPWAQELPSVDDSEANVRQAHARFLLREDLRMVGFDRATGTRQLVSSGLHRIKWEIPSFEIGYWARSNETGKGYTTEMARALTRLAFDLFEAKRVEIRCDPKNLASAAIAKRLGFELEAHLKNQGLNAQGTEPRDTLVFARINAQGL